MDHDPEYLVEHCQSRPAVPPFERQELLAEAQVLDREIATAAEGPQSKPQEKGEQTGHGLELHTNAANGCTARLLSSQLARVFARDASPISYVRRRRLAITFCDAEPVKFPLSVAVTFTV